MSAAVVAVSSMHRLSVLLLALERSYNMNSPGDHRQKLLAYVCMFCLILVVTTIQGWCLFCSELCYYLRVASIWRNTVGSEWYKLHDTSTEQKNWNNNNSCVDDKRVKQNRLTLILKLVRLIFPWYSTTDSYSPRKPTRFQLQGCISSEQTAGICTPTKTPQPAVITCIHTFHYWYSNL